MKGRDRTGGETNADRRENDDRDERREQNEKPAINGTGDDKHEHESDTKHEDEHEHHHEDVHEVHDRFIDEDKLRLDSPENNLDTREEVAEYLDKQRGNIDWKVFKALEGRCKKTFDKESPCVKDVSNRVICELTEKAGQESWKDSAGHRLRHVHYIVNKGATWRSKDLVRSCPECTHPHEYFDQVTGDDDGGVVPDKDIRLQSNDDIANKLENAELFQCFLKTLENELERQVYVRKYAGFKPCEIAEKLHLQVFEVYRINQELLKKAKVFIKQYAPEDHDHDPGALGFNTDGDVQLGGNNYETA